MCWPACGVTTTHVYAHRSSLSAVTTTTDLAGTRSTKSAGHKTEVAPIDIQGNTKDVPPLDIQARVSRRSMHAPASSGVAALIWGGAHASLQPRPPPQPRGKPPVAPPLKTQLPFCFMPHHRTAHRFLPEAAPPASRRVDTGAVPGRAVLHRWSAPLTSLCMPYVIAGARQLAQHAHTRALAVAGPTRHR